MGEKVLSVIVLTYKHGDLLFETIDSILCQDYPLIEIIIAEDGSNDFEEKVVKDYIQKHAKSNLVEVQILCSLVNLGTVRNINKALEKAQGKYVKIIAGDDVYPQNNIFSEQVKYLEKNPAMYLVFGNIVECDAFLKPLQTQKDWQESINKVMLSSRNDMLRYFCKENSSFMATQSICFRKKFFSKYGIFDEKFKLIEDLPMVYRIITENISFGYQEISCVNHRGGVGVSTSNNPFDINKIQYYEDLLVFYDLFLEPVKDIIGNRFVNMRRALIEFRIEYSQMNTMDYSMVSRLGLIIRNLLPIVYYGLTRFNRFINYIRH